MRGARPDTSRTGRLQRTFLRELGGFESRGVAGGECGFRRPQRGTVENRWHVYTHGYMGRLNEAVSLEYPAIARILGADAFAALVRRYAAVFPPRSFDLAQAGDRLERFLEFDSLALDLPFLPDLARLERAVSVCFTAADSEPIQCGELGRLEPEEVARVAFRLAPGVALVTSGWPLADLWNLRFEADDEAVSVPLEGRGQSVLVWRCAERVRVDAISAAEASLVASAGVGGLTLEDLRALSGTPDEATALETMLVAFRSLVERGVLVHQRRTGWAGAREPKEDS
jgi:hypothetical protein